MQLKSKVLDISAKVIFIYLITLFKEINWKSSSSNGPCERYLAVKRARFTLFLYN